MKHVIAFAAVTAALVLAPAGPARATAFDAETILVNANAVGNAGGFSNVIGAAEITKHGTAFVGAGNPHDEGTATASTVGFYTPFVILPHLVSNIGKATATATTINTDGDPTGVGAGASAHFRLFIEVLASSAVPLSALGAVPVDVGWHVAGSHTAGGNDFAEIAVSQMAVGGPNSGRVSKFVEQAVDADRSGVTRVFLNLSIPTSLDDQLAVDLRAACFSTGFSVVPQVTSTSCTATADPTFSIPSDFAFADQITLGFSPNLAPAAVPQLPTGWLVAVAVLCAARRARRVPRRHVVAGGRQSGEEEAPNR